MLDLKKIFSKIQFLLYITVMILFITFFAMENVSAFYCKSINKNVDFETYSYQDLTYSLDKSIYASCSDSSTVNLTITNFNAYAVSYTLSFSNTTPTYLIDGAAATTYTVAANSSNTNSISISGATGTSITITIDVLAPYATSYTQTVNFDNVCPTVSFSPNTSSTYAHSASVTVTVTDNGSKVKAGQSIKYRWQSTNICSTTASDYTSTAALSNTSSAATTATATATASGLDGTYYLCVYRNIEDVAGNKSIITVSGSFLFDSIEPAVSISPNTNTTYAKTASVTVTVTDSASKVAPGQSIKYRWQDNNNCSTTESDYTLTAALSNTSAAAASATATASASGLTGTYYLCIYSGIEDIAGNGSAIAHSNMFLFDNTAPTITANDFCIRKGTSVSALAFASAYDNESGLDGDLTATINDTAVTDLSSYAIGTYTVTYSVSDAVGNVATETATLNVYMLAADIPVVTSGNGLRTDQFTSSRKAFRGSSVNNYLTLGGITWRILGIESDGTIRLVTNDVQTARKYRPSYSSGNLTFVTTETDSLYYYLNNTFKNNLETAIDNSAVYGQIVQSHSYSVGAISVLYYASYSGENISKMITQENATKSSFTVGIMNPSDIARASNDSGCTGSTLQNNAEACYNSNYLNISNANYYFMNPYNHSSDPNTVTTAYSSTLYYFVSPKTARGYRAVIYLKADTKLQGSGTSGDPYTVSAACSGTSAATCTITTDAGYDTSKTLTANVTLNGTTISNYVWSNGTSGASATTANVTSSGTHTLTIFDSNNLTNTCSISLSSRQEYRQATCTSPTYTNWSSYIWSQSTSCNPYELELSKGECPGTYRIYATCTYNGATVAGPINQSGLASSSACVSRAVQYEISCNNSASQQYPNPETNYTCYPEMRVSTRSCSTCNAQGAWGNWQTTPIEQNTCSIVIGTRTTIGQG